MAIVPGGYLKLALWGAAFAAALANAAPAHAQGKLDARFVVTLAGLQIGKGAWVIDIADDQFTAAASGATTGVLQIFASGTGSGASRGSVVGGRPVPLTFASSVTTDRKTEEVRMTIVGGNVKDYAVTPAPKESPERIPVTEGHRLSVHDPMTASLIRVPGNGDPMRPEACQKVISIFDGRMRFDLKLSFKRFERVKAERGYDGPSVVCAVQFTPISGHVPTRPAIKYLVDRRDIEVWLAPIASTRVVVPFRVVIPTPIGQGVMQATQFVTMAAQAQKPRPAPPAAAAAAAPKTQ